MKRREYTEIICRVYCSFYKPGREGLACGTYNYLTRSCTQWEIRSSVKNLSAMPDYSRDTEIREVICRHCAFITDGCDFRDGKSSPPCGGYVIVEKLLK